MTVKRTTYPRIDLDVLQAEAGAWCDERFPGTNDADDALCIAEEAGEVCRAVLKRKHGQRPGTDWDAEVRLEAADVIISVLCLAYREGWSLADAVTERWEFVKNRTDADRKD